VTVFDGPIAASTAGPSVMLWATGLAMISPGITKVVGALLRWPVRAPDRPRPATSPRSTPRRATVAGWPPRSPPIMLATGIATANLYLQTTQVQAAEGRVRQEPAGRFWCSPPPPAAASRPGLIDRVAHGARRGRRVGVRPAPRVFLGDPRDTVADDDEDWQIQGVSADGADATTAVGVSAGKLGDLRGNSIALPEKTRPQARRQR